MNRRNVSLLILNQVPLILLLLVFAVLGCLSDKFLELQNLVNILIQSSAIAIAAIGMTFVLVAAGVDLSIGSLMFVAVAVTGKLIMNGQPVWLAAMAGLVVGVIGGVINAIMITRLKVIAFIATLAMLFIARGFGLWLTNTRAMNLPSSVTEWGSSRWFGVPLPILILIVVALISHWMMTCTPAGRQLYAIGNDAAAARKAGVQVGPVTFAAYVLCGLCAALSGLIALSQTGAVSPSFGQQKEFAAIAAAVLGGTSLLGGRGTVLPGAVFGAILFQTVENGLVIVNADPYLYPMILSGILFLAVLLDTTRDRVIRNLMRRHIRAISTSDS